MWKRIGAHSAPASNAFESAAPDFVSVSAGAMAPAWLMTFQINH
jgi:hypothetical protein